MSESTTVKNCQHCGQTIHLIQVGITQDSYKWVTDPNKAISTWKCAAPDFPVRSHSPKAAAMTTAATEAVD